MEEEAFYNVRLAMIKQKYTQLDRPIIVESVRMETIHEAIEDIQNAEKEGAQAFLVHLELLKDTERTLEGMERIFAATNLPIMALNYRAKDGSEDASVDEKRAELLIESIKCGASMIDVWGDMFDYDSVESLTNCAQGFATARPKEISMRESCVQKQKALIEKAHELGAEVLMSAHVGTELSCEQAISLAKEIESRGADIVKIITTCDSKEHIPVILQTIMELKKHLRVPYMYQCGGKYGKIVRPIAPFFGSIFALCHLKYGAVTFPEKPLLADVKEVFRIFDRGVEE